MHSPYPPPRYTAPAPQWPLSIWENHPLLRYLSFLRLVWKLLKQLFRLLRIPQYIGALAYHAHFKQGDRAFLAHRETQFNKVREDKNYVLEEYELATHDGARINTVEIYPRALADKKEYLIHIQGRGLFYEHMVEEMKEDATVLECKVMSFNFRNNGLSRGHWENEKDLLTDVIALVEYLLAKGVPSEKITLAGFSLGGGFGALAAHYFLKRNLELNHLNLFSFASLTQLALGYLRASHWKASERSGHHETFFRRLLSLLAKPLVYLFLLLNDWNIDAASAYRELPARRKRLMVIDSDKGAKQQHGAKLRDDATITDYGSLHTAEKPRRQAEKRALNKATLLRLQKNPNFASFTPERIALELKLARACLKVCKMVPPPERSLQNAHSERWDQLRNRYNGNTARQVFWQFYKEMQEGPNLFAELSRINIQLSPPTHSN